MQPKYKVGDRVRYTGKIRYGRPIPTKDYHIRTNGEWCSPEGGYEPGDYEYDLVPTPENIDPIRYYTRIKEGELKLINPSRLIYG